MTTAVEPVLSEQLRESLLEGVRKGTITKVAEVQTLITPAEGEAQPPAEVPLPAALTAKQKGALKAVEKVFGQVAPTEKRTLTDEELTKLLEERNVVDTIEKLAKARKEKDIRTIFLNHLDRKLEERYADDPETLAAIPRDKDGHYLVADRVNVPGTTQAFSWEVSDVAGELSAEVLAELDRDGEIDHNLYLSVTRQVRVIDEDRLFEVLSEYPEEGIDLIKKAAEPNKKKGSLYVRAAK